jgi:hypothetical protein
MMRTLLLTHDVRKFTSAEPVDTRGPRTETEPQAIPPHRSVPCVSSLPGRLDGRPHPASLQHVRFNCHGPSGCPQRRLDGFRRGAERIAQMHASLHPVLYGLALDLRHGTSIFFRHGDHIENKYRPRKVIL